MFDFKYLGRILALGIAACLFASVHVRADDKDAEIQELRNRLDKIEKVMDKQGAVPEPSPEKVEPAAYQVTPALELDESKDKSTQANTESDAKKTDGWSVVGDDLNMKMMWNYGLIGETADKAFRIHVGGRTQADAVWGATNDQVMFGTGGIGTVSDGVNFRRARLEVDGTIYEIFNFWCEYDFLNTFNANGAVINPRVTNVPVPTDLWGQISQMPYVGNIRIGNQKPPIGFEHLTSSRFLNFMERSLGFDAFVEQQDNGFEPGIQMFNWSENERFTWAIGLFKHGRNVFGWNIGDGEGQLTGRVTCLPWYENDGRCLLHLGFGANFQDSDDRQSNYRARTLIRNGPATLHNVVTQTFFNSQNEMLIQPELVFQNGPFLLQTEYSASWTSDAVPVVGQPNAGRNLGTVFFWAYYIEGLYFLTGENRIYDKRYPRWDRVIPNENFYSLNGIHGWIFNKGAWQVSARYSVIDLQDKGINGAVNNTGRGTDGATVQDWTFGLNWFLNPNAKVQWNYSIAYRNANNPQSNGPIQVFGTTLRFDF